MSHFNEPFDLNVAGGGGVKSHELHRLETL